MRDLWNLLPPRDDQSLLKYVVYRLEESESLSIATARNKILGYTTVFLLFAAAMSLMSPVLKGLLPLDNTLWISPARHTLIETFGSVTSIIIGMILTWEYLTSGRTNILFLVYAFFSIGILDFFHAFADYSHNLFVWYHSLGALLGSFFFFCSMFVRHDDKPYADHPLWIRRFSVFSGAFLILVFAVMFHTFNSYIPDVLTVSLHQHIHVSMAHGKFSASINAVNYASCVLYLFTGILFVRGFLKTNDLIYLIFGTSSLLFFISQLFFPFSELWNPLWWYWHVIVAIIFLSLLLGLAYGFTKSFYRLYTSRIQLANLLDNIERKNMEIEKACVTLKETQRYLNESEKLASIGKMAAMMAHEIRNPLGAISNSVGVLRKYSLSREETAEILSLVEDEMDRLNKLTEDFLSFAKPSQLRRSETNVNNLLVETLSFLNTEEVKCSGIIFQESFAHDVPPLMLDKDHIKQVFINILVNSMQAIPQDGVIAVQTRHKKTEDEVEIIFVDTGVGMPDEVLSQVFQPFYTTKDKGLGLGLNIVHKIVKEHGGYIALSSRPGEGTQIKLSFPVSPKTVHANALDNVSARPDTILSND